MRNKTIFLASGSMEFASARIRAYWLQKYLDCSVIEAHEGGYQIPVGARAYVWAKRIDIEAIKNQKNDGSLIFWDFCDPLWWFDDFTEIIHLFDGVVFSTSALEQDFRKQFDGINTYVIPDRIELEHYDRGRKHVNTSPLRFIWFGIWANRFSLYGAFPFLERARRIDGVDLTLTIFDDRPDTPIEYEVDFPILYQKWKLDHESETLAGHDIAILPAYPEPWGSLKSNNKRLSAWASFLPVVDGCDYGNLIKLSKSAAIRQRAGEIGRAYVQKNYNIEQSAREWERVINENS